MNDAEVNGGIMAVDQSRPFTRDLVEATTRFCRMLRERGLAVSPEESIDAVRALGAVDLGDRSEVYLALRALLTSRREDLVAFDRAFDEWFASEQARATGATKKNESRELRRPSLPAPPPGRDNIFTLKRWAPPGAASDEEEGSLPAPSTNESLATRDF